MTNEQVIEKLIDQINNDMQIFIAVLSIVIAIAAFLQWRISDKQIQKMQIAIKEANNKSEKLAEMNKVLVKNSLLTLAGSQFLGGLPDWKSDIEFFNYIKENTDAYNNGYLIKYAKSKIADDFAHSINEACGLGTYYPDNYLIYKKDNPKSQFEYIVDVKENEIAQTIDALSNNEKKRKLFHDFQEFLDFWNNN